MIQCTHEEIQNITIYIQTKILSSRNNDKNCLSPNFPSPLNIQKEKKFNIKLYGLIRTNFMLVCLEHAAFGRVHVLYKRDVALHEYTQPVHGFLLFTYNWR